MASAHFHQASPSPMPSTSLSLTRFQRVLCTRQLAYLIKNPDGKLPRQRHWPLLADEKTEAPRDQALAKLPQGVILI